MKECCGISKGNLVQQMSWGVADTLVFLRYAQKPTGPQKYRRCEKAAGPHIQQKFLPISQREH